MSETMSDGDPRTANGASADVEAEKPCDFLILRTFSKVKPKRMAAFMNGMTWQAAWLRHFHRWERVLVGYSLTDIPERVLEIYAVPLSIAKIDEARAVLEVLHKQDEYGEMKECCNEKWTEEELLLPPVGLDTRIKLFICDQMREHDLVSSMRGIESSLEEIEQKLSGGRKTERGVLASQQTQLQERLKAVRKEIQDAREPERRRRELDILMKVPAYFLSVAIKVHVDKMDTFEQGMRALASDFKWKFLACGKYLTEPDEAGMRKVMNLWTFSDANDLYRQMSELRENERFAKLDEVTADERQMLMCDWEALSHTKRVPSLET